MFGLFKKKEDGITVTDKVVISEEAKLAILLKTWNNDRNTVFAFWFEDSLEEATAYFSQHTTEALPLILVRELTGGQRAGRNPVFAEHYPLRKKETELYQQLGLEKAIVYSSLREPLFQQFGGDKIVQVMKQMGMKEDELIEHSMISSAIKKAQEKIEARTGIEQTARSQKDWIEKNYTPLNA